MGVYFNPRLGELLNLHLFYNIRIIPRHKLQYLRHSAQSRNVDNQELNKFHLMNNYILQFSIYEHNQRVTSMLGHLD